MAKNITVIPASKKVTEGTLARKEIPKIRMAAYCRVSTDQEEQLSSYENQVSYKLVAKNPHACVWDESHFF